jgi:hypothetical protein
METLTITKSAQIVFAFPPDLDLYAWTNAVYENAVGARFIHSPWQPSNATIRRLHGYFEAGLSPAEAAYACFSLKH